MHASTTNVINVVVLGVSFMLVFTAFQTGSMIEPVVLDSVRNQTNGTYTGDGYVSLAVIYATFALLNWIAPPIVVFLGPRLSMIVSALLYNLFIALFVYPMTWALYVSSALVGLGAAVLWTAQGSYLTLISTKETMARNSGIFWALLQCSLLFGNLFVYFEFKGLTSIDDKTRNIVYGSLAGVCFLGILTMLILRRPAVAEGEGSVNAGTDHTGGPLKTFKKSIELFMTKRMALLCVTFFYTGLELTFFSGVFGTSIGHTGAFAEDAKDLIGISGMVIGAGEIIGGLLFGILGDRTRKHGRDPIIMLGYIVHMVAFYLVFINLPPDSPIKDTSDVSYIASPSKFLALLCSFLLGFADASFNTQLYSILGVVYQDDSAPAFALFKFMQSAAAAIGFFYSNHLGLPYQLLILVVTGTAGCASFMAAEWSVQQQSDYSPVW